MSSLAHTGGGGGPSAEGPGIARPTAEELIRLLGTAEGAARAAAAILCASATGQARVIGRPDHDLKLDVDLACEEAIIAHIRDRHPSDSILSEEKGLLAAPGARTWVVDPLDGTVNFAHGLPLYCTSVACLSCRPDSLAAGWAESLEAAAVLFPATGELYLAARGEGATLDGVPLAATAVSSLDEALVSVAVRAKDGDLPFCLRLAGSFAAEAQKVRFLGFVAGELAMLAAGRLDAVVTRGANLWDISAGALIAREAGATVSASPCARGWQLVAAAAGIHARVLAVVEGR